MASIHSFLSSVSSLLAISISSSSSILGRSSFRMPSLLHEAKEKHINDMNYNDRTGKGCTAKCKPKGPHDSSVLPSSGLT
uniref:Uncharacterized protein n=1 Tax=Arundo donax TaxID=35708 RepID=A0A0A8YT88_ARUDO